MKIKRTKSFLFRLISVLTAAIMTLLLSGCATKIKTNAYKSVETYLINSDVLATNANYCLNWDSNARAVILKSNLSDDFWSDILYKNYLDGNTSANGNSPLLITVCNTQTLKTTTIRSYSEISDNGSIICKKIENGIRVSYFFDKYKIAIPVDYVLRDDSLQIVIDSSKIMESGLEYKLVSISLVPYFCSVENAAENGFLFVPVGCGALMHTSVTPDGVRKYKGEVYGDDAARQIPENYVDNEAVKLPVFGASGSGRGMFGIIESGAGSAVIEAQSGNDSLGYSNVFPTFYVRGYDVSKSATYSDKEEISTRYSENISGSKLSVSYYPLFGDDSGYNGMANLYREYLTEKKLLKKSDSSRSPYSVTFVGGTNVMKSFLGIPYKKLVSLTTFKQAKNILEDLKKSNGTLPTVRLTGYGDGGIRPGTIAGGKNIPSLFGNKNAISDLVKYCTSQSADLFFDFEIIYFSKSGNGYYLSSDTAKTAILKRIEHYSLTPTRTYDYNNKYNVLSRNKLFDAANTALRKAEKYDFDGVCFSSLGSVAFSDFDQEKYYNKSGIEKDTISIMNSIKKNGKKIASADSNSYSACASDTLFDINIENGDYKSFDETVPFYQMVFGESKTMYTIPVNLSGNIEKNVAKSISYGMGMGFTLSNDYIGESIDLDEYRLYGILYDDNKGLISKYVFENGYADIYNKISGYSLKNYELMENGVSVSTFSNGVIIYVNNNKATVDSPIGKLNAYEFKIGSEVKE